jgi:hypothetical protein
MNLFSKKIIAIIFCIGIFSNFTNAITTSQNVIVEIYSLKKNINLKKWKNTEFEYHLVFGNTDHNEINQELISKLKKTGYKISLISNEKSSIITNFLASKKDGYNKYETGSKKVFRNIIIFKRQNEIIKIIKLDTNGYANAVINKNSETEILLSFNDYDQLEQQLKE